MHGTGVFEFAYNESCNEQLTPVCQYNGNYIFIIKSIIY